MSAEILSGLLAANIAASAGIILVILIRKPARQVIGARLAYWLWLVPVLAGLATLLPERDAGAVPAPAAPIQPIAHATVDLATSWTGPAVATAQEGFGFTALLVVVWAAGAVCFLGLILLMQQRTMQSLNLPLGRTLPLNKAASNFGPAVVGVLRPLLVVPADFEQRFSPPEQDLVLAHERVHLAEGHTRINAALVVFSSLSWFNPLVHWAARLARIDQELACDAAVLERFPGERGAYAEALLKAHVLPAPLPLGCTWPSRSSHVIKERMTMLANKTPGRARRMAGAGFIAVAMLGTGLVAWAQKPPVPAFAGAAVTLDKDGHVLWSGKPADGKALAEQAKAQVASGVPHIKLSANANTQYINVQPVLEAVQKAGMQDITFQSSGVVFVTPTPAPRPPPSPNQPKPVRVFIDFDDGIFWNGVWLDLPGFERNLADQVGPSLPPPEIHIEPNKQAKYARVEQVLAAIKKAGLTKVGFFGGGPAGAAPILVGELH